MSYFALSHEGALDFGKFAVEKQKTKKDPPDLESKNQHALIGGIEVPVLNQIVEEPKF
jgi:hypothetical protein